MTERQQRRLAAILAADIAGYSALMGADEARTVRDLKAHQAVILPMIGRFGGRIIDTAGDGILAEFTSVVDAVECASAIQETMAKRNAEIEVERRMQYRIGINVGDVMFDDARIYGDGINVAARLESIAEPGGICISSKVYEEIRSKVRLGYQDIGEQQLKNITYPVRVYRVLTTSLSARPPTLLPPPEKPSIAVLPFQNLSGDSEREYFADGMVEEIITTLSRVRWLFVIARNSSFTYKGRAVDVKQVGRELGVLYVLEGSVRKAGNRIRITAQLLDTTTGGHLWADRFDGTFEDVFELQDNVASSVAGVIEPTLREAEQRRSIQRPTDDLTAYDLFLRARAQLESWEREGVVRAIELIRQALERDPNYGSALAGAVACRIANYTNSWTNDLEATRKEGVALARKALRVAGDDPFVLANAAWAFGVFGEDIAAALALVDRALQLNPSYARGWLRSGWLRLWAGQYDLGINHFDTSARLSPRESRSGTYVGIGVGHFFARRSEKAIELLGFSLQEKSTWPPTLRFMASCLAHMGRLEEAKEMVKRLRAITPVVVPTAEHWRIREDREYYLEGLRLAVGETDNQQT
jgi:adenylate cyclase